MAYKGGNVVPERTRLEHQEDLEAKRVTKIDPFGGLVTEGNFTTYMEEVGSDLYIGAAQIGTATNEAGWQIRKINTTGGVTSITWGEGTDAFVNVWDNRASLTYS